MTSPARTRVPLSTIAHGRSGDKGNHSNVAVIAYTDAGFAWLREHLTADVVAAYFAPVGPSRVVRFEASNVRGLNFVLYDALAGGASRSLRTDTQGKAFAVTLLRDGVRRAGGPRGHAPSLSLVGLAFMTADPVLYARRGSAAVVTLNRPDRRNALNRSLVTGLTDAVHRADADPDVRCLILTGAGTAFCAGMDLDELRASASAGSTSIHDDARQLSALYDLIYRLPKPTVAAVNGPAVAGGCGLVTVCDIAIGTPTARFGYPEVRRGLVAAMVAPHLLRQVGERTARWLLLTGDLIDGVEALRMGLLTSVASDEQLLAEAVSWCARLAEGGPNALAATKAVLATLTRPTLGPDELAAASAEPRLSDECRDGLSAFFAKRPTPWSRP